MKDNIYLVGTKKKFRIKKPMNTFKRNITIYMKSLPGLAGVEEEDGETEKVPGVPGTEDAYKEGYLAGYEHGAKDSKMHQEPDDDDKDKDDDDDDMETSKYIPKTERASWKEKIKLLAKRLFGGPVRVLSNSPSPSYSEVELPSGDLVSVITIDGEIGKRLSAEELQEGKVDLDHITEAVKMAKSANTKSVIFHINSPGGTSIGVEEAGDQIKKLNEVKPTLTFVDTICASAAYWLASCTNGIYATPSSEIGSIGVYAKVMDMSGALEKQGIKTDVFQGGSMKGLGHGDKPLTDEEKAYIQGEIDAQYKKFTNLVNENRGGVGDEHMQGQLMSADKAVEANLADELVPDIEDLFERLNQ